MDEALVRNVTRPRRGSVTEAEDAVQQAWLRLGRSDAGAIIDMRAWLTTVVGRICLDMLRARKAHRVEYVGAWLPEPLVEEWCPTRPSSATWQSSANARRR